MRLVALLPKGAKRLFGVFKHSHADLPDEFFFSFQRPSPLSKEYWFLHFCSPSSDEQLILTFGRSSKEVEVNEAKVPAQSAGSGTSCAAVCWYCFGPKKKVALSSNASVFAAWGKKGEIFARHKKGTFSISGKFPFYTITLALGEKRAFFAKTKRREGRLYEFGHILPKSLAAVRLGAQMVNFYLGFKGEIEGKRLSGKAYLQKVSANIPLAPWNWVRIEFESGSTLDFFAAKPLGKEGIKFAENAYFEHKARRYKLSCIKLESWLSGKSRIWALFGKNFICLMESYCMHPFVMRQKTTFFYDEYAVRVKFFSASFGKISLSQQDVGEGRGIVEDARGFLV